MFEAMACRIPIVSSPWDDAENLFTPEAYFRVATGEQMKFALRMLLREPEFAAATADAAYRLVMERHTCRHRALELLGIVDQIRTPRRSRAQRHYREMAS
jgi:spore maturation protein CgeB